MSVCCQSEGTTAWVTPESPPIVNIAMKPTAKSMGVVIRNRPPHMVPSQLNILIPVGMAIVIVARPNAAWATGVIPEANM